MATRPARRRCRPIEPLIGRRAAGSIGRATRPSRRVEGRGGERMTETRSCGRALAVASCGGVLAAPAATADAPSARRRAASAPASGSGRVRPQRRPAGKQYTIGYSNGGGVGNGFREEQVCTAKAQALASGQVSHAHRRSTATPTRPASCPDIRDLIAQDVERDRLQPERPRRAQPGPRRGEGRGHQDRRGRRVRHRPEHLQPVQQPGEVRLARRQVAVRAAGRQGQRLVHARPRRPPGRHRPRHRLQERPRGVPGHQGRPEHGRRRHRAGIRRPRTQLINDFIASGGYDNDPGHLDVRHGLADRRRDQGRRQAVRADRRRRHRRLRQAAPRHDATTRASRARP